MSKALFIIDFDLTISQEHVHNLLAGAIVAGLIKANDTEAQWQFIKNVAINGTKERWKTFFETLLKDGHDVAIASFCDFKPIVERYLREKIGLDEATLKKIYIESWLPQNANSADKTKHIENVIHHFNFQGKPELIVLVDDSKINCRAARAQNHTVVEVLIRDQEAKHIETAMTLSKQLAEK